MLKIEKLQNILNAVPKDSVRNKIDALAVFTLLESALQYHPSDRKCLEILNDIRVYLDQPPYT